jgi:hypothetical protein
MVKNYLKTTLRHLWKHKIPSFINVAGLSMGLSCFILLGLYIRHELSYDSFHEKADRISLFTQWENDAGSGSGFAPIIRSEIAQVESVTRIMPVRSLVGIRENAYYEDNFCFADSTISGRIAVMLSYDYVKLVLIANALAFPVAWKAMEQWLQIFSYHIKLNVMVFFIAGIISVLIAMLAVSGQSLRASIADPVKSLRNE